MVLTQVCILLTERKFIRRIDNMSKMIYIAPKLSRIELDKRYCESVDVDTMIKESVEYVGGGDAKPRINYGDEGGRRGKWGDLWAEDEK